MGLEISPKHTQIYHPKIIQIFIEFCHFFDTQKWSKMEPSGILGGVPGALWEGMASHSAPKRLPRVPKGLPRYPQGFNFDLFWTCC